MTPPRRQELDRNSQPGDTFTSLKDLERRMENGEKELDELKKAIDDARESSSEVKAMIAGDRLAVLQKFSDLEKWLSREFGKLEGMASGKSDVKWIVTTGLALLGTAIAAYAALHSR